VDHHLTTSNPSYTPRQRESAQRLLARIFNREQAPTTTPITPREPRASQPPVVTPGTPLQPIPFAALQTPLPDSDETMTSTSSSQRTQAGTAATTITAAATTSSQVNPADSPFQNAEATDEELYDRTVVLAATKRAALLKADPKAYYAIAKEAKKGMLTQYKLLSSNFNTDEAVASTTELDVLNQQLIAHCQRYDLLAGLRMCKIIDWTTPVNSDPNGLLLPESYNWLQTDLQTVAEHQRFVNKHGKEYTRVTSEWLLEYLQNSTDAALQMQHFKLFRTYDKIDQGPLLYFKLLMDILQTTNDQILTALEHKVETMTLPQYNDNVPALVLVLDAVLKRIDAGRAGEFPHNIAQKVLHIFTTSPSAEFNSVFQQEIDKMARKAVPMWTMTGSPTAAELGKEHASLNELLATTNAAVIHFKRLEEEGNWPYLSPPETAYYLCFNCGSPDHRLNTCPHPHNEARIKAAADEYSVRKKKQQLEKKQQTKPSDTPSGDQQKNNSGRGRGRGRGRDGWTGRGRGRGKSKNKDQSVSSSKQGKLPKRPAYKQHLPPGRNEAHVQFMNGNVVQWCHHCNSWVTNHSTSNHEAFLAETEKAFTAVHGRASHQRSSTAPAVAATQETRLVAVTPAHLRAAEARSNPQNTEDESVSSTSTRASVTELFATLAHVREH